VYLGIRDYARKASGGIQEALVNCSRISTAMAYPGIDCSGPASSVGEEVEGTLKVIAGYSNRFRNLLANVL